MHYRQLLLLANLAAVTLAYPADKSSKRDNDDLAGGIAGDVTGEVSGLVGDVAGKVTGLVGDVTGEVTGLAGDVTGQVFDLTSFIGDVLGGHAPLATTTFHGLSSLAAAALQAGALGSPAGKVDAKARKELHDWLLGGQAGSFLDPLKSSLVAWCEGEAVDVLIPEVLSALALFTPVLAEIAAVQDLFVTVDGILSGQELDKLVVLDLASQKSLLSFLSGTFNIDSIALSALRLAAVGGVADSLSKEVIDSLHVWLLSSSCTLEVTLVEDVLAWLFGNVKGGAIPIGSHTTDALTGVSVGKAIGERVLSTGVLSQSGLTSIAAFLETELVHELDNVILVILQNIAKGGRAVSLSTDDRRSFATWLSSKKCTLDAELISVLLLWLSIGSDGIALGISPANVGPLSKWVGGLSIQISLPLRGALGLLMVGEGVTVLSYDALTELIALISGATGLDINIDVLTILISWVTGSDITRSVSGASSGVSGYSFPAPLVGVPEVPARVSTLAASAGPSALPTLPVGASPVSVSVSLPAVPNASGIPPLPSAAPSLPSGIPSLPSGVPALPSGAPSLPSGIPALGKQIVSGAASSSSAPLGSSGAARRPPAVNVAAVSASSSSSVPSASAIATSSAGAPSSASASPVVTSAPGSAPAAVQTQTVTVTKTAWTDCGCN